MAESVDALVSNTSGATRAGSTPALGTFEQKVCADSQRVTAHSFIFGGTMVDLRHFCCKISLPKAIILFNFIQI